MTKGHTRQELESASFKVLYQALPPLPCICSPAHRTPSQSTSSRCPSPPDAASRLPQFPPCADPSRLALPGCPRLAWAYVPESFHCQTEVVSRWWPLSRSRPRKSPCSACWPLSRFQDLPQRSRHSVCLSQGSVSTQHRPSQVSGEG